MTETKALQKLGEIKMPEVTSAQLARLDPSVPYIILLPERTPDRVVQELVGFLGRSNVMATILMGDPKNFRLFASTPWSVTPQKIPSDIHPLKLEPKGPMADILERNFISALHDDAEAVEVFYGRLLSFGFGDSTSVTELEAMVRCGLLKFQVLNEVMDVAEARQRKSSGDYPADVLDRMNKEPFVDDGINNNIVAILMEFTSDTYKASDKHMTDVMKLAAIIEKLGTNSKAETEVLRLQNAGQLMSGVLSALRNQYPALSDESKATKTPRKTTSPTVKKRAPVAKKK